MRILFITLFASFLSIGTILANPEFQINGGAYSNGPDCFTLTEAINWESGAIWTKGRIDLNESFDLHGSIFLGCNDANGADGITFILQGEGPNVSGGLGGGLGYLGIGNSLAVEFDTWQNPSFADPAYDHVALISNGALDHSLASNLAGPVTLLANGNNAEDCAPHLIHLSWNPATKDFKVFVDNQLRIFYNGDIVNDQLGGQRFVYWGFTGNTGAFNNVQEVCINSVSQVDATDFTLIDAVADQELGFLEDGDIIDLATLPTNKLNVRANLESPAVKSIRFSYQNVAKYRVENFAPYALFGDKNGNYKYSIITPGVYTISATPYDKRNAKGNKGEKRTIEITFIDSNVGAKKIQPEVMISLYPNPVKTKFAIELDNLEAGKLDIEIYNISGLLINQYREEVGNGKYNKTMDLSHQSPGMYIVKIRNGEKLYARRLVKI